jgi:hypothetical protein
MTGGLRNTAASTPCWRIICVTSDRPVNVTGGFFYCSPVSSALQRQHLRLVNLIQNLSHSRIDCRQAANNALDPGDGLDRRAAGDVAAILT